jgi:beta-xylosidase
MHWRADGWPVMGHDPDGDGKGEPVLLYRKPDVASSAICAPATSDNFESSTLGLQWQWQANPRAEWANLTARPGYLRLRCVPLANPNSHWLAPHLLLQKFPAPVFVITVSLQFFPDQTADTAGLMVFGYNYAWLGFRHVGKSVRLLLCTCESAQKETSEQTLASIELPVAKAQLRVAVGEGALCHFSYSLDGQAYKSVGPEFAASSSHWVGAKVGMFASAAREGRSSGYADFRRFSISAP